MRNCGHICAHDCGCPVSKYACMSSPMSPTGAYVGEARAECGGTPSDVEHRVMAGARRRLALYASGNW